MLHGLVLHVHFKMWRVLMSVKCVVVSRGCKEDNHKWMPSNCHSHLVVHLQV